MLAALIFAAQAPAAAPVTVPPQAELVAQITKADAELFKLFFEGPCDLSRFRAMVADDLEFYHDKGGFDPRNGEGFVAQYQKRCSDLLDATTWRSRRELVPGSLHVDPVPGWGAMEVGDHVFYEKHGAAGEEKLVGKAKFAMVWVLGPDEKWRVSRVLSYAHTPAGE